MTSEAGEACKRLAPLHFPAFGRTIDDCLRKELLPPLVRAYDFVAWCERAGNEG